MKPPFQINFPRREIELRVTLNVPERLALAAYLTEAKKSLPWLIRKLILDELSKEQKCKL